MSASKTLSRSRMTSAQSSPRIIAVSGGSQSNGKTTVALNLAMGLARNGARVLLLDGSSEISSVSLMLGRYPARSLHDVVDGRCELRDAVMTAGWGLHILAGGDAFERCAHQEAPDRLRFLKAFSQLEKYYDYLVIDACSALTSLGMHMVAAAELSLFVVSPEASSLKETFSVIKALVRRGYQRSPGVLVNQSESLRFSMAAFDKLSKASEKHLDKPLSLLGIVPRDHAVLRSSEAQRPLMLASTSSSPAAQSLEKLAEESVSRLTKMKPRRGGVAAYWYRLFEKQNPAKTSVQEIAETCGTKSTSQQLPSDADLSECQDIIERLGSVLERSKNPTMVRYEAFNGLFALMGRTFDEEDVEILQTGLASLPWDRLESVHREQFAEHLRYLADQLNPPAAKELEEKVESSERYVSRAASFSRDAKVQDGALRAVVSGQSVNISLDQLLRSLSSRSRV